MLDHTRISLNALKVFALAAETESVKAAAETLGRTAGAVSHQIRVLEDGLGTALFIRKPNGIALTEAGRLLQARSRPGLDILDDALRRALSDADSLSLDVSASLATRWLIPKLDGFRTLRPTARIRFETHSGNGPPHRASADLSLYYQPGDMPLPEGHEVLLRDVCRPYVAPRWIASGKSLGEIPALQCGAEDWDWDLWRSMTGLSDVALTYGDHFDMDDVGIRAAVGGLGMVLASAYMVREELDRGLLVPLPGTSSAEIGCFALRKSQPSRALVDAFLRWLQRCAEAESAQTLAGAGLET